MVGLLADLERIAVQVIHGTEGLRRRKGEASPQKVLVKNEFPRIFSETSFAT